MHKIKFCDRSPHNLSFKNNPLIFDKVESAGDNKITDWNVFQEQKIKLNIWNHPTLLPFYYSLIPRYKNIKLNIMF